jgi:AcrR family transcriptional regulator
VHQPRPPDPRLPNLERRSERARRAILDAALRLCAEQGYARVTVEAIAAAAGAGKQTIYRWWRSKGAVVLDALLAAAGPQIGFPDTGDVRADVEEQMAAVAYLMTSSPLGPPYRGVIAESQYDPALAQAFYARLTGPRMAAFARRLAAGQAQGQVAAGIDLGAAAELLYGPVYHRLLLHSGPLTPDYVARVVDMGLAGLRPVPGPRPPAAPGGPPPPVPSGPGPGDARGGRSRQAILRAAYELCGRVGFGALTIEAIAARAGVGKQTIYRWWPSKGAVVLDALLSVLQGPGGYPDTGDMAADLRTRLAAVVPLYVSRGFGPVYRGLIAESQFDPALAADLYARLIGPRMAAAEARIARAQEQGQVDKRLDPHEVTELAYGALHHRLLLHGRELTAGYAGTVVDLAFGGIGPSQAAGTAAS